VSPAGSTPKRVVKDGYDAVAEWYLADRPRDARDMAALEPFARRVPAGASVLDLGCGAGVPVTSDLHRMGYAVVGLDLSMTQLRLAAEIASVPLTQGDMSALPFVAGSFDGVVAYYSIIHVPRDEHETIAQEVRRVLVPGGHALLVLGTHDLPADHDDNSWFGVPMFWSHYDADTSLKLLSRAGFGVVWNDIVEDPMGHGEHLFVLVNSI
jgi:SAM-dependent methyltransferase